MPCDHLSHTSLSCLHFASSANVEGLLLRFLSRNFNVFSFIINPPQKSLQNCLYQRYNLICQPLFCKSAGKCIEVLLMSIRSQFFVVFFFADLLQNSLAHPPYGIRGKLEAARLVELMTGT